MISFEDLSETANKWSQPEVQSVVEEFHNIYLSTRVYKSYMDNLSASLVWLNNCRAKDLLRGQILGKKNALKAELPIVGSIIHSSSLYEGMASPGDRKISDTYTYMLSMTDPLTGIPLDCSFVDVSMFDVINGSGEIAGEDFNADYIPFSKEQAHIVKEQVEILKGLGAEVTKPISYYI